MEKSNISRRFPDKMATAQQISTKPSTPNGGHIHTHIHNGRSQRVVCIPFMQGTFNGIIRLLVRFNIRTVLIPGKTDMHLLRVKNDLGLKVPGMHCIPCECGKVYMGQMSRTTETRHKEQAQPDELALAKHRVNKDHRINFKDTRIARMMGCMDSTVKETDKIWLHPNNFNRDMGFTLSQSWNPATNILGQSSATKQQCKDQQQSVAWNVD
jgi:hypothetical protein